MGLKNVIRGIFGSVELIDVDEGILLAGEKVASVWKNDFTALPYWNVFVLLNGVLENIHHPYALEEPYNNLESSWVESHTHSIFIAEWLAVNDKLKAKRRIVAPNFDSLVIWASDNQVLFDANVHA